MMLTPMVIVLRMVVLRMCGVGLELTAQQRYLQQMTVIVMVPARVIPRLLIPAPVADQRWLPVHLPDV